MSGSWLNNVMAVFEFELRRAMTPPRIAWWCLLAFFPVVVVSMILIIQKAGEEISGEEIMMKLPTDLWAGFLFVLIPMLISMLGTFLWTAPAVSAELERQSWTYLAVRPHGRDAVLLGKYLAAISWVVPATLVGATVSLFLIHQAGTQVTESDSTLRIWSAIMRLSLLAVPAYSAIYLAIGTLFTKRAMVVSVAYTLIFELVASFVPALINKLTIQYRLRALFVHWSGIDTSGAVNTGPFELFSPAPVWQHVGILLAYIGVLLVVSVMLVRQREYVISTAADAS